MANFVTLLPGNASPRMRAQERTSGERWPVDADALRRAQDPWECPVELLPWLAYNVGVDLWYDDWDEQTKRRAIAAMPRLKKLKGTVAGIRGYLDLLGVPITYVTLPPSDGFYEAPLTEEQRAAWLAGMPQLRIYRFRDTSDTEPGEGYFDDDLLFDDEGDATCFSEDTAPLYDGERFFLWKAGTETPLPVASVARRNEAGRALETVTAALPMPASDALLVDDDAWDDGWLLAPDEAVGFILTLDLQSILNPGSFPANPVGTTNLVPTDARFEQVFEASAIEVGQHFYNATWLYDDAIDGSYYGEDDGYLHAYKRIYLVDRDAPIPDLEGGFCLDGHLWGLPPQTAIVGIDVSEPAEDGPEVWDADDGYYVENTFPKLDRALEAIRRAQGGTDVIIVDTVTFKQLTFGDRPSLDGTIKLGQMIERNYL